MVATVYMFDETASGVRTSAISMNLEVTAIRLRDLIEHRVRQEVAAHNAAGDQRRFRGLVQPTDSERTLNGFLFRTPRALNADTQVHVALEAFEKNGFFVLFDDRQVEDLDEVLPLSQNNEVSFLRLVPLVGG